MSRVSLGNLSKLTARLPLQIAILGVLVLALALAPAACGGEDEPAAVEPTPASAEAISPPPAPTEPPATPPRSAPTEAATGTGSGTRTATRSAEPTATPAGAGATESPTGEPEAGGGWLRVGAQGAVTDTFNPFFAQSLADYIGLWNVYDSLAWLVGADFMMLLTTPLQTAWWTNRPAAAHAAMMTGSNGGFNLTGIAGEEYDSMLGALIAEVDAERRLELASEVQEYLYENDGQVVWAFQEDLNAAVPGLSGVIYSQSAARFHRATWEK